MKSAIFSAALLSALAQAGPIAPRQNIDTTVLQFALTLEHLENVFYQGALNKFSQADFQRAGYSADYYNNLKYISHDEQVHVEALSAALKAAGVTPNAACTYNFPYTDVKSFITLSSVLEGVGTSAYLGGAPLITSKAYLTVAGSILAVEALHTSLQRLAISEVPMANPFMTPLDPTSVYTLAASFIVSCPSTNTALPFTAYPGLMVDNQGGLAEEPVSSNPSQLVKRGNGGHWGGWKQPNNPVQYAPKGGSQVCLTAAGAIPAGSYVTFVNGLSVTSVQGNVNGNQITANIPTVDEGQTYVFVTKKDVETTFDGTAVLYGPAVLEVAPMPPTLDATQ